MRKAYQSYPASKLFSTAGEIILAAVLIQFSASYFLGKVQWLLNTLKLNTIRRVDFFASMSIGGVCFQF